MTQVHRDITLYKYDPRGKGGVGQGWKRGRFSTHLSSYLALRRVAALGLATGIVLVLLLLCLYRVLCPRNYGQHGAGPGRRRRGELPCDDYGYTPPETEIVPLLLRGHLMVSILRCAGSRAGCRQCLAHTHTRPCRLRRTLSVWRVMACCW